MYDKCDLMIVYILKVWIFLVCFNRGCVNGCCLCWCFVGLWLFLRSFVIGCCSSMWYERGIVGKSLWDGSIVGEVYWGRYCKEILWWKYGKRWVYRRLDWILIGFYCCILWYIYWGSYWFLREWIRFYGRYRIL